jgi:hypothetical protein
MKKSIKINFADFWPGFIKEDNYFTQVLSQRYDVQLSDDPDFLFYSCYGKEYLKYTCIRIFYTAENVRPDFFGCDYALSFDIMSDPRQYRLPLYALYIGLWGQHENVLSLRTREDMRAEWTKKTKFCCMLVSNGQSKRRIDFFHRLSTVRQVDSGGRYLNNVGGPVDNKLEFIKNYKFVFAFENSSYVGYVTEKLIEPCFMHSIPIYWGNPKVSMDFNPRRFINAHDYPDDESLIQRILEIDQNDELALDIISQPIFNENQYPEHIRDENVLRFFKMIFDERPGITPVAQTSRHLVHRLRRLLIYAKNRLYYHLGLNFR